MNAFSVKISRDEPISELKKAIKAENVQTFANIDAKDIKLWKVEIPDNHDDQLSNLSLQDQNKPLATREIEDYWSEKPHKWHIHVIVKLSCKCLVQYVIFRHSPRSTYLTRLRFQFSIWKRRCRVFHHL
jgi:hypothetical protein